MDIIIAIVCIGSVICTTVMMIMSVNWVCKSECKHPIKWIPVLALCYMFPTLMLIIGTLSLPDRDKNMYKSGYKAGTEQRYVMRVDTIWIPKTK